MYKIMCGYVVLNSIFCKETNFSVLLFRDSFILSNSSSQHFQGAIIICSVQNFLTKKKKLLLCNLPRKLEQKMLIRNSTHNSKIHYISRNEKGKCKKNATADYSDVFGDPKPKEDVPESLILEHEPTSKSRTRNKPDVSRS